jgi:electron transfer flavoprotein beta subunit
MLTESTSSSRTFIVCVKYTVDVETIRADPITRQPNLACAAGEINDSDKNGIEAALQLRDEHGGRVLAVSLFAARPPDSVLLRALAMGVDELHMVCDIAARDCDAFATAVILGALIRKLATFDLVVCGDASRDECRGEVGPRLAEVLHIPAVTHVTRLTLDGAHVQADRALESCLETAEAALPTLLTVGNGTNQPRMPTLRQIGRAAQKPTVEWRLPDLASPEIYGDGSRRIETLATYAMPSARKRIVVDGDGPDETARGLVRHLVGDAAIKF